ncbi:MAG: sulfotransferase [Candidatus Omnitrophica bacterium]|nr:sulfotransferase [Candidatus Omnitrophota bacterium]
MAKNKIMYRKFREWLYINKYYLKENFYEWKHSKKEVDFVEDYQRFLQEYDPCFVLSTGRCGTRLLTKILSINKKNSVYHSDYLVPNPLLKIYQNKAHALKNQRSLIDVLEAARGELIYRTYRTQRSYIETNSRFTFFAYAAKELFPKSKFIHLVRNPADFVISGLRRQWYQNKDPGDIGRLKINSDVWDKMEIIEKVSWLWNETNTFIEEFKTGHPKDILTVRSEDLFQSIGESKKIFDFLGSEMPGDHTLKKMISKSVNKQLSGTFRSFDEWTEREKSLFIKNVDMHSKYDYVL